MKNLTSLTYIILFFLFSCTTQTEKPPNIIFILADDLGYGDIGCYGQQQIETPNLDQLANEGMRFTQHYAGSTVCAPSRCCLITGLHTGHALIRGNASVPLQENSITVGKLLKDAGYRTGHIGKWGLGEAGSTGAPNNQGFDHFFGYLNQIRAHNFYPDYLWRNGEKVMLDNEVVVADKGYSKGIGTASTIQEEYSHDLFTREAFHFIEESKDTSFFLYLAYTIPHANNEHWLIDEHGMEVPDYGKYADKEWPEPQKGLAAMISRMDADIGKIKQKLEELGIAENTFMLFTSDNGPHAEGMNDPDFFNSNGPLKGIKRDLYEGGIRVPMIAWWPGRIKPGSVTDHISAFWDFLPTACDVAGMAVPQDVDGISYLPVLLDREQEKHEFLYWEFFEQGGKQAVRKDKWKGVRLSMSEDPDAPIELYNLQNDLSENNNVAAKNPGIVVMMDSIMNIARTESPHFKYNFEKND
jgi:arylsulfatase A-like enzyme